MFGRLWLVACISLIPLGAQTTCDGTAAWSPCEFSFELPASGASTQANPYVSADLHIEFRSPRFKTYLMPAYWDGGRKLVVRFVPTESGAWTYRISSKIESFDGKSGSFNAGEASFAGYVHVANVHHWATDDKKAHLWMGYVIDHFATMPGPAFDQMLDSVAANKFNHVRAQLLEPSAFAGRDQPNLAYFAELDRRILAVHKKGITTDAMLGADPGSYAKLFPDWQSRKRFVRYIVGRYAALNVTWQGFEQFEGHASARAILKEQGLALKELDPYDHPRSTNAKLTSSPFLADGWMNFVIDHSANDQIGAVEHQFYQVPFVGVTPAPHLWSSTMDGQYPEIEGKFGAEPKSWFDFMADTRHWELEPYFDVDAARCVALEGIEYVVLVEKPGPVEVEVEKHGYDVSWMNPATGEAIFQKKYKGEHYTGSAPDGSHPWVLLIAREGRKESMLKSYKFESRVVPVQEIEQSPSKVPFVIADPAGDTMGLSAPVLFSAKITRATRATRSVMYLWTAEAPADGLGFRVLGTGAQGTFPIPADLATRLPAAVSIRVQALNANGKAYAADKVYQLSK